MCRHCLFDYFCPVSSVPLYGASAALTSTADSKCVPERLGLATRDKLQGRQIAEESALSDHKQEEAFRVIDRRPFTAEGELRKEVVEEEEREAKREAAKVPATPSEAPKTTPAALSAETPNRIAAFATLVRMLDRIKTMVL